jgi:predicted P-loop ATPase
MDENRKLCIATAKNRFERAWRNEELTWDELRARLADCVDTGETAAEFRAMGQKMQTQTKDVGGFVGGYLRGGIRKGANVERRSVVTLDYDEFHSTRVEDVRRALPCRWLLHSTHKHREDAWRVRLVVPLSRDVTVDEYGAVARRVAERIGFSGIDRSTFEPVRLMFWPSRSTDAPWLLEEGRGGTMLDVDAVLGSYADWRDQSAWPMLPEEADALRLFSVTAPEEPERKETDRKEAERIYAALLHSGQRAEDPREKRGLVGTFCRCFTVGEAIAAFIPEVYTRAARGRYTHVGSSTFGGAMEFDGERFLFSFHATDPVCGKLLNAWDLVRLHKFGHLDASAEKDTRMSRLPSTRAMEELAMGDPRVTGLLAAERQRRVAADFEGIGTEERDPDEEWKRVYGALPWQKDGSCRSTITAAATILMNDPEIKGRLRFNEFTGETDVEGELPWKRQGNAWTNNDDSCLRSWFDAKYGITGKEKIADAFVKAVTSVSYHPVRDYLNGLQWDGVRRLERVFPDILGAEDSRLNRRLGELIFGGAVTRIFRPGCKFDYFVILQGPEGSGKSSLLEIMGGAWFSDSVVSIEGKEGMEAIQGVWIAEIGELIGVKRSEAASVKSFISRLVDKFRPAYGRVREVRPRQCVVVGTTNEELFLRGVGTGNRRSPVVEIRPELRKCAVTVREWVGAHRDQLWAEAVELFRAGMPLFLDAEDERAARKTQETHNLDLQNPLFGEVVRFIESWVPFGWESMTPSERRGWYDAHESGGSRIDGTCEPRRFVSIAEILQEGLGMRRNDKDYLAKSREVGAFLNTLKPEWVKGKSRRSKIYGVQITWDNKTLENNEAFDYNLNDL